MLQWMGGSKRKVTTLRKSTQKRQKQYFEQRKHQQQKMQITGSDGGSNGLGISGEYLKEHRSLDILNLLNLPSYAQEPNSACLKGTEDVEANVSAMRGNMPTKQPTVFTNKDALVDSCRYEEARVPLGCQIETSPKKFLVSAPDGQSCAFNETNCKPSHWKTVTEQHLELSVFDLLYDDEHNVNMEECPTCEDHVAFSLEGLGKVGTETPIHSPQQQARTPYGYSPLLKDGRKTKLSKNLNNVLEDLDLEVDAIMQDIEVIRSSPNFPYKKGSQSLAIVEDCKHYDDHNNTDGSSISQEFYYNTENNNEDMWNVGFGFLDEKFENEMEFEASWKNTFQMDTSSPDLLKSGAYKMDTSCVFDDLLPKKRNSVAAMEDFNMIELPASYSKFQSENDFDYFVATVARCSRSDENFNHQNLVPDDLRDNSSLLSEESCSSTAVRGEAIKHSPSRLMAGENGRKRRNDFASAGNKYSSKEGKCRRMSNPSKRKPFHHSNSSLQEELGIHDSWQFEERYATISKNSGATSFCQNLERKFAVSGSKNRTEDPFSVFTTPELHKASPSFGGFKNDAPVSDPSHCSFTSEKFAFAESPVFANVGSWPTRPKISPNFQFKGKPQDVAGFHFETLSPDVSVQESISKDEAINVKLEQDSCRKFEPTDEIFMGDNGLSSERKMEEDASTSNNNTQECEGREDTNPKIMQTLEQTLSLGHVEEISSSLKKPANLENKVDKRKNNCVDEIPLQSNIANEEMENWQPEERNRMSRKHNCNSINLFGQVMFESYVLQLLCVQKVLKEASMHNIKKT